MQLALPRVIFFMGKAELFKFPLLDIVFRNCGAFPVYRGEKDTWAMRHARAKSWITGKRWACSPKAIAQKGKDWGGKTGTGAFGD